MQLSYSVSGTQVTEATFNVQRKTILQWPRAIILYFPMMYSELGKLTNNLYTLQITGCP